VRKSPALIPICCVSLHIGSDLSERTIELHNLVFATRYLIIFGLFAVTSILFTYSLQKRSRWYIVAFAAS
jgi:hypothetical protein